MQSISDRTRFDWVRLRTLVMLRWLAIIGQALALVMATQVLGLELWVNLCAAVIGMSVLFNIVATFMFPENRRLSERGALLTLLFDLLQLSTLLYLNGGLANPFAMLLLTPVVIAATALNLRATVILGSVAVLVITGMIRYSRPMLDAAGNMLAPPELFILGTWAALLISIVFLATYAHRVTVDTFSMSQALAATQMALDRETKLAALGGVVAAAAHELGTPLATIKLVSSELLDDADEGSDLAEDLILISQQADRCRDILRDMGRTGKDDTYVRRAPITAVIDEAAAPHVARDKDIIVRINGVIDDPSMLASQPLIQRKPEVIHGLRNLIQNAVDFAYEHVWIDIEWDEDRVRISVGDDGPGYPPDLLGRIGDPFVRRAGPAAMDRDRPDYQGMGLGLFIAKTLLERSGARMTFTNGTGSPNQTSKALTNPDQASPTGAIARVTCPRNKLEETQVPVGENQPNTAY